MSKDGTIRGGARMNSGPSRKALKDRIIDGTADRALVLPQPAELIGVDTPQPKDYMLDKQKGGDKFSAGEIFKETYQWLKVRGCENLIARQLIDQYSVNVARWIQCQRAISEYGFLSKHPTTGAATTSPFVTMSRDLSKQINADWYQIYSVVRDNCTVEYGSLTPHDAYMEQLLSY